MLTIGTGIGGGIVVDDQVVRGATGAAGELGHMVIDEDGPPCSGAVPTTAAWRPLRPGPRWDARRRASLGLTPIPG